MAHMNRPVSRDLGKHSLFRSIMRGEFFQFFCGHGNEVFYLDHSRRVFPVLVDGTLSGQGMGCEIFPSAAMCVPLTREELGIKEAE